MAGGLKGDSMNEFIHQKNLIMTRERAFYHLQQQIFKNVQDRIKPLLSLGITLTPGILAGLHSNGVLAAGNGFAVTRTGDNTVSVSPGFAAMSTGEIIVLSTTTEATIPAAAGNYYIYVEYATEYEASGDDQYFPGGLSTPDSIKTLKNDTCTVTVGVADAALDAAKIAIARVYVDASLVIPEDSSTNTIKLMDATQTSFDLGLNTAVLATWNDGVPYLKIGNEYVGATRTGGVGTYVFTVASRAQFESVAKIHHFEATAETITWSPVIDMRQTNLAQLNMGEKEVIALLDQGLIKVNSSDPKYLLYSAANNFSSTIIDRLFNMANNLTIDLDDGYGERDILSQQIPSIPNRVDSSTISFTITPIVYELTANMTEVLRLREAEKSNKTIAATQLLALNQLKAATTIAQDKSDIQALIISSHAMGALTDQQYHDYMDASGTTDGAIAAGTQFELVNRGSVKWFDLGETISDSYTGSTLITNPSSEITDKQEYYSLLEDGVGTDEVVRIQYIDATHVNILVRGCFGSTASQHLVGSAVDGFEYIPTKLLFKVADVVTIDDNNHAAADYTIDTLDTPEFENVINTTLALATFDDAADVTRAGMTIAAILADLGDGATTGVVYDKQLEYNLSDSRLQTYEIEIYNETNKIDLSGVVKGRLEMSWTEPALVDSEAIVAYKIKVFRVRNTFSIDLTASPFDAYTEPDEFEENKNFNPLIDMEEPEMESAWKRKTIEAAVSTTLDGAITAATAKDVTTIVDGTNGLVKVNAAVHGFLNGDTIYLPTSTNHSGQHTVINKAAGFFYIAGPYIGDEGAQSVYKVTKVFEVDSVDGVNIGDRIQVENASGLMEAFTVGLIDGGLKEITVTIGTIEAYDVGATTIKRAAIAYDTTNTTVNKYQTEVVSTEKLIVFIAAITQYEIQGPWSIAKIIEIPDTVVDPIGGTTFVAYVDDRNKLIELVRSVEASHITREVDVKVMDIQQSIADSATKSELYERTPSV